jgi:adenylosuccinate lyase
MVGRTHGQHALPITLGFKFANWLSEVIRHLTRLEECCGRVIVGKFSGAVGTQAGLGSHVTRIQKLAMEKLGLRRAEISTQIISRDRYAELICILANISSSLDNFATEIRELQRPEIGELAEPFDEAEQIGSSTMPQKRNPILCERISGLARILRGLTVPALENVVTWHERDLTQSSSERFIIPEACILVDYMISLMYRILKGLVINEERMRRNLDLSQGRLLSEAVMMQLVKNGMRRWDAYHLMRQLALKSEKEGKLLKNVLLEDAEIRRFLSEAELSNALNPEKYLGSALKQIEDVLKHSTF